MTIDLSENKTKVCCSYVELPFEDLSMKNIQNKPDNLDEKWCITVRAHPIKTNACRTKISEKPLNTFITTGIKSREWPILKTHP